jgi:hypothetical protein
MTILAFCRSSPRPAARHCRGTTGIATFSAAERDDLLLASRSIRRLLAAYERGIGRQLSCIMLGGA